MITLLKGYQITDSQATSYRTKSVIDEDKLQTYNKLSGVIRRHFGQQATKETKLRIHSITDKAALKFGSEAWVLKESDEQTLEVMNRHWKR
jgi:hypothetical protein